MRRIQVSKRGGNRWLEVDECSNAMDYLERVNLFLTEDRDSKWKWVSIALHGALYGFGVLAIMGTNPYGKPPEGSGVGERTKKGDRLIGFDDVLRRIPVSLTPEQKRSIRKLQDMLRNNFVHFTPKQHSIGLDGMPQIIENGVAIIEHLVFEVPRFRMHEEDREFVRRTIDDIRRNL